MKNREKFCIVLELKPSKDFIVSFIDFQPDFCDLMNLRNSMSEKESIKIHIALISLNLVSNNNKKSHVLKIIQWTLGWSRF